MQKAFTLGAINPEQKDYYNVLNNFLKNLTPTGGQFGSTDGRRAMFMYDNMNPDVTQPRINQALAEKQVQTPSAKIEQAQITQESFTTVEASLNNNSSAVNTLTTNVQTLNTSISTLISTFANNQPNTPNANNNPAAPTAPTAAPATASANIGPFNTVVNGTLGGDFNLKIEKAINSLRSEIYSKLEIKTPPQQRP